METEYKIEILLTPHSWDNPAHPYFWVILESTSKGWGNTGHCGWEITPEQAWLTAIKRYNNLP